jgi:hypothetical protein
MRKSYIIYIFIRYFIKRKDLPPKKGVQQILLRFLSYKDSAARHGLGLLTGSIRVFFAELKLSQDAAITVLGCMAIEYSSHSTISASWALKIGLRLSTRHYISESSHYHQPVSQNRQTGHHAPYFRG